MNKQAIKAAAQKAFQENRLQDARELFTRLCGKGTADADAWFLLGATHGQLGALDEAERCFRKAVTLAPAAFTAWDNLGISLLHQQRLDEAETCFRRAAQIQPGFAGAHNNLGNALRLKGRLQEAEAAIRRALQLDPNAAAACNNLAIVRLELGDAGEAAALARRAVALDRSYADAWHNLGEALCVQGQYDEAMRCYQAALQLDPAQLKTLLAMAGLLEQVNRRDDAHAVLTGALDKHPSAVALHIQLARLTADRKDSAGARRHYEAALRLRPDAKEAIAGIAGLLAFERKYPEAYATLQPFLAADDDHLSIALVYADISHHVGQDEDALARLERLLAGSTLPEFRRSALYFALARLHERLGHYAEAFQYYRLGNTSRPLPSDLRGHLQQMERIRTAFNRTAHAQIPVASRRSARPVFIVGMPRSGTSLIEQILASHSQVHGGGELTDLWAIVNALPGLTGMAYPECAAGLTQDLVDRLAQDYLGRLDALSADALRVTDKLPHNFLHLGLIAHLFPDAQIIHCRRDPLDTCLSIYFHDFNQNNLYARDLNELGRYYRAYASLMAHWRDTLGLAMLEVRYEDLVADVEKAVRAIVGYCGLDWEDRCLRFYEAERTVYTPSREQVRRPIYASSVGRWRHYADFIEPLQQGLGDSA
jgi:tetratricopeptide (TPR) repeat protein